MVITYLYTLPSARWKRYATRHRQMEISRITNILMILYGIFCNKSVSHRSTLPEPWLIQVVSIPFGAESCLISFSVWIHLIYPFNSRTLANRSNSSGIFFREPTFWVIRASFHSDANQLLQWTSFLRKRYILKQLVKCRHWLPNPVGIWTWVYSAERLEFFQTST
jgi:hypothetical protein